MAEIAFIEYYLPQQILTNEDLQDLFDGWSSEKIYQKTGVSVRHIAAQNECSSDLGIESARKLITQNGIDPNDIDVLIFCTETPDYCLPTTACIVQDRLGLPKSCASFDINLGCSGFVYGLSIATAYIHSGMAHNVLLITAETYSKVINPLDKSTRTIFGDAGASTLICADRGFARIGDFVFGTDGSGHKNLIVPTSGFRIPKTVETSLEKKDESVNLRSLDNLYMDGPSIFTFALDVVPKTISELLDKANLSIDDIDFFIFHQVSKFMLQHLIQKLHIPEEKAPINLENYGNTVSCSIPITLRDCQQKNLFKKGDRIMLIGFGVGYSWASALLEWKDESIP
ncbi:TPA: ketoacyl-ACP synthase III [Candidatus Poribacteria bacterium]|nr:ketoacyl-ACP synthase III [Candidatus Poribacteria bacterium]